MEEKITAFDGSEMILIPEGNFTIGISSQERERLSSSYSNKEFAGLPECDVYLDSYYIDKHLVTNKQYMRFTKETGHSIPTGECTLYRVSDGIGPMKTKLVKDFCPWNHEEFNKPNQPVVCISWEDAKAYAEWARKRLPTEAEWEKAARGIDGRVYPWGNEFFPSEPKANWWEAFAGTTTAAILLGHRYTAPVGSFPDGASPYGIMDMVGNVWEWVSDWYRANCDAPIDLKNPCGPEWGRLKVVKGGGWLDWASIYLRCSVRTPRKPSYADATIGFRCVMPA